MKKAFIAALWLLSLTIAFFAGNKQHNVPPAETIIITRTDTVRVICPEVTAIYVRGETVERLPVAGDTAVTDSAEVIIPLSQTVYAAGSYKAYVSGYRPKLDSLVFTERHYETTRLVTKKTSRWSIGLHAGYGITPRGFQPFIGIGVSFRIYQF